MTPPNDTNLLMSALPIFAGIVTAAVTWYVSVRKVNISEKTSVSEIQVKQNELMTKQLDSLGKQLEIQTNQVTKTLEQNEELLKKVNELQEQNKLLSERVLELEHIIRSGGCNCGKFQGFRIAPNI
jgi:peptidoglycan hydrolase CwlO-like protein